MQQPDEIRFLLDRLLASRYFEDPGLAAALVRAAKGEPSGAADSLRGALQQYFRNEGCRERFRAAVPADQDRVYFYEAGPREISVLEEFWLPYLSGAKNVLLHGLTPAGGVTLDEMYAVLRIATWLQDRGSKIQVRPAGGPTDLPSANLILTGNCETNPALEDDSYPIRRRPGADPQHVVTAIRDLAAARFVTGDETMRRLADIFPAGFPPDFGIRL